MTLWEAEFYDQNSKLQQKIAENFLNLLQEKFEGFPFRGNLLDAGCGTGRVTNSIHSRFPEGHIIGIDASKEMIKFANQNFSEENVVFYQDRVEELKMIDNKSIDGITSFSCLHWVHDQEAAFRALYRVLKPGGWIGLTFCAEINDPIDHAEVQAIQEEPWNDYFKDPTREADCNIVEPAIIKSQLEKTGFQINFMGTLNFDFVFESVKAFELWILACFQQLKLLPSDLQLSCVQRIAELYLQATAQFQPKGPQCIYKVDMCAVVAKK